MSEPTEGSYGAFVAAMANVKEATELLYKAAETYLEEMSPKLRALTSEQKNQILEGLRATVRRPRPPDEDQS